MTPEERVELVEDWIEALRSGEYDQGWGRLKKGCNHYSYCCLGVLCEISGGVEFNSGIACYKDKRGEFALPPELRREVGMSRDYQEKLANYNDKDRLDFEQIADEIEQNFLPKLKEEV